MVYCEQLTVQTNRRCHWVDITPGIQSIVVRSKIGQGVLTAAILHTTAGLTINENADPDVERDFFWKLGRIVPQEPGFHHGEGNSDSHIKASFTGFSVQVPLQRNKCVLGTWQSIYVCEFDGPRTRVVAVTVMGD